MSQHPSQGRGTPPPVPPAPLSYHAPPMRPPGRPGDGGAQKVFDTVAGPNLRLRDNLIQLACVGVGSIAGGAIGYAIARQVGMLIGVLLGLVGALVLSGAVIGVIRFKNSGRR